MAEKSKQKLLTTDRGKKGKTSGIKTIEQYKAKGKEINEKYCDFVFTDFSPIMLPPAPKQTYIDVYRDEEGASSSNFEDEKRLQANYEAEVKVYRALERLEEDILVLHGFEYTHHQYRLCDTSHDRRSCRKCKKNAANREGECDFIVIGRNYFVIIEVKNIPHDRDDEITEEKIKEVSGAFKKAQKQQENVKYLIDGLVKQVFEETGTEMCSILSFSAFPSTKRSLFTNMDEEHKQLLICEEVFLDFGSWWRRNVTESITQNTTNAFLIIKHEEVKEVLLAIWCTDKDQCDELKCSLGKCIMDIDEELRKGRITFVSKNRPSNPNVVKVSDIEAANINTETNIFRDYIGVEYLTAEQYDAFNRDQNLLLLNGPAGSGKTIILLAKIIQHIKADTENKALLFIGSETQNEHHSHNIHHGHDHYQKTFKKADIGNKHIDTRLILPHNVYKLVREILVHTQSHQVVIVKMEYYCDDLLTILRRLIGSNINVHVFLDDFQSILYSISKRIDAEDLTHEFKELSVTNLVWIACDLTQNAGLPRFIQEMTRNVLTLDRFIVHPFVQDMPSENRVTLSLNLRNTCDIAGILSKIREELVRLIPETENSTLYSDVVLPAVQPGHFIHGPRTVVHVIDKKVDLYDEDDTNLNLITSILNMELDKLCNTGLSQGFKIGIVNSLNSDFDNMIHYISPEFDRNLIEICDVNSCYSAEYTAVIVLNRFFDDSRNAMTTPLYLEMSRARVYCAVIIGPEIEDYAWLKNDFDDALTNVIKNDARIIRYMSS